MIAVQTPLSVGFGSQHGTTVLSDGFASPSVITPLAVTRLGQKGAGRHRDGVARFVVGESDDIYAYVKAATGAYVILSATFQLVDQFDVPLWPPYFPVDYREPVPATRLKATQAQSVFAFYFLETRGILPGDYTAKMAMRVRTTDNQVDTITCVCQVQINEG